MRFDAPFGGVVPGARGAVLATLLRTSTPLTGRQVHALVSDTHSLWTVQQELRALGRLGLVRTGAIGRAGVHTINEDHVSIGPLRELLDPLASLTEVVRSAVDLEVEAVILFGSVARGDAAADSDIDLAVVAPTEWEGRVALQDAVRDRLGNACDVVVLAADDFAGPGRGEPVLHQIRAEGVVLLGSVPSTRSGAA